MLSRYTFSLLPLVLAVAPAAAKVFVTVDEAL
jgi:hypothetical protein